MKKIFFCGGGSAGHVVPNIAIMRALAGRYELGYIGTSGIEYGLVRREGIKFYTISAPKLDRGRLLSNLTLPCRLKESVQEARTILQREEPRLLFCKGRLRFAPSRAGGKEAGNTGDRARIRPFARACQQNNFALFGSHADLFPGNGGKIPQRQIFGPARKKGGTALFARKSKAEIRYGRTADDTCVRRRKRFAEDKRRDKGGGARIVRAIQHTAPVRQRQPGGCAHRRLPPDRICRRYGRNLRLRRLRRGEGGLELRLRADNKRHPHAVHPARKRKHARRPAQKTHATSSVRVSAAFCANASLLPRG